MLISFLCLDCIGRIQKNFNLERRQSGPIVMKTKELTTCHHFWNKVYAGSDKAKTASFPA